MSNNIWSILHKDLIYHFHFHRICITNDRPKYFITAFTKDQEKDSFEMKQLSDGNWRIVKPASAWLFDFEEKLSHLLCLEESQHQKGEL